jgi:photosystem II stability/assembly factor-like uncharacterized protein
MKVFEAKSLVVLLTLLALFIPAVVTAAGPVTSDSGESSKVTVDWRSTGPGGGDVRALVVDPNDEKHFFFGTLDGQIYSSVDGGETWKLLYNFNRPQLFVDNIIVDPRDSRTLYVATHRHKDAGGFYKSTDGGRTWRESPELKNEALHSLTQSSADPNVLVTGTNTGVFRSSDSGDTWTRLETANVAGLHNVESLAIDPRNSNVIYAGTWYLPYKSTDAGKSWSSIKDGMIDDSDIFAIDIDPRNPEHIIASACSGIYDSRNSGGTWRKVQGIPSQSRRTRAILQHPSVPGLVFAGTTEGFWRSTNGGADGSWTLMTSKQLEVNSIAVHPKDQMTVLIGTNNYGVMVSHDGGKTFAPSNGGYSGRFANFILSDREIAGRVYATTINTATGGGFFFVSSDGGQSWKPSTRNMPARLIGYSILQDERNPDTIYLATNFGIYTSVDRGGSWAPLGLPKPAPVKTPADGKRNRRTRATLAPASKKPDPLIIKVQTALNASGYKVGTPDGHMGKVTIGALRSYQSDKGMKVSGKLDYTTLVSLGIKSEMMAGDASANGNGLIALTDVVNSLVPTHDERDGRPGILAATNGGLYRSYNPAEGWERVMITNNYDQRITAISTSPKNSQTIWVGTTLSGVLVSRDSGATWEQVEGIPTEAPVASIKQDPQHPSRVYVGTKQTFYVSTDDGRNWDRRGGNLPYGEFATILINPKNPDEIFVGNSFLTVGGLYRSSDGGQTWSRLDTKDFGLPSRRVWALEFDGGDPGKLFVGSHSAGIYLADVGGSATASRGN